MSRDKILSAAIGMFTRKGYDATSISEIAADVGIRKPSIYSHFSSKQEIFMLLLQEAFLREKTFIIALPGQRLQIKEILKNYLFDIPARYISDPYLPFWLRAIYFPPADLLEDISSYDLQYARLMDQTLYGILPDMADQTNYGLSPCAIRDAFVCALRGIHGELSYRGVGSATSKIDAMWQLFELAFK